MDRRTALRSGLSSGALLMMKGKTPHEHDMSRGRLPYGEVEAMSGVGALVEAVTLDGVKLENCFRANEIEGWADVYDPFPDIIRKTGRVVFHFRKV